MSGWVLALSFGMLATGRRMPVLGMAGGQIAILTAAAIARGAYLPAAILALSNAAVLVGLFWAMPGVRAAAPRLGGVAALGSGGVLAMLAAPFGVPLAVVATGILLVAIARDRIVQAAGLLTLQAGLVAAALDGAVVQPSAALLPILPGLALAALRWRGRLVVSAPPRWTAWAGACAGIGLALALPILSLDAIPNVRQDRAGVLAAVLVALAAAVPTREQAPLPRWCAIAGGLVAALADDPIAVWAGLLLATAAALLPYASTRRGRLPLAAVALGLTACGWLQPASPVAAGCVLVGAAALAVAVPDLLAVLPFVALRAAGPELVALGIAAVLACGAAAVWVANERTRPAWLAFGQTGVVAMLFGLHTADTVFAGAVLAVLLVLAQAVGTVSRWQGAEAAGRSPSQGLVPLLAAAGLVGLPPFGVFPGLALAILAIGRHAPGLLLGLLPGLAALGWAAIVHLPAPGSAARVWPPRVFPWAWIPLVAAPILGFCMPDTIAAWLHALAQEVAR